MYGKIFASMYEGTLYGQWEAIVTFQQLIVLSDQDGVVEMTPPAIAARTSIPLEHIERGLRILAEPDPYSRTPGNEGRRIELIDPERPWGWRIVNHQYYRDLASEAERREKTRERVRKHREKQRNRDDVTGCNADVTPGNASNAIQIQITDTDKRKKGQQADRFEDFWSAYPRKEKKKQARDIWKRRKLDGLADAIVSDVLARAKRDPQWLESIKLIPHPTSYLNAERWTDEWESKQRGELGRIE